LDPELKARSFIPELEPGLKKLCTGIKGRGAGTTPWPVLFLQCNLHGGAYIVLTNEEYFFLSLLFSFFFFPFFLSTTLLLTLHSYAGAVWNKNESIGDWPKRPGDRDETGHVLRVHACVRTRRTAAGIDRSRCMHVHARTGSTVAYVRTVRTTRYSWTCVT
jgi:hypothetical protein